MVRSAPRDPMRRGSRMTPAIKTGKIRVPIRNDRDATRSRNSRLMIRNTSCIAILRQPQRDLGVTHSRDEDLMQRRRDVLEPRHRHFR